MELLVKEALEKLFKEHGIERLCRIPRVYDGATSITLGKNGRPFDVITQRLEIFVRRLKEIEGCTRGYILVTKGTLYIRFSIIMIVNRMESCIYHHVPPTVDDLLRDGIAHPPRLFQ